MYCQKCGKEVEETAVFCSNCGEPTGNHDVVQSKPVVTDSGDPGWAVLGCCIPLVGLILFLVWQDTKPKTAKKAGIGALIGVGLIVALYFLIFMLGASSMGDMQMYYN